MSWDRAQSACDDAKKSIDKMMEEVSTIRAELAKLKTDVGQGGIVALLEYPWRHRTQPKSYGTPKEARATLTRLYEESKPIGERNEEIAKHNRMVCEAAVAYMAAIGVPDTFRKPKKSRGWQIKYDTIEADWKMALRQSFPVSSGWSTVEQQFAESMRIVESWEHDDTAEKNRKERERQAEETRARATRAVAAMVVKYGLPVDATDRDVLDAMLSRNKYLRLAYWLERNRGDWNEGPHYASVGLDSFSVESDTDKAIAADIGSHISDWDGDGRIFRDCDWNYGKLYVIAAEQDEALVADFNALREFVTED